MKAIVAGLCVAFAAIASPPCAAQECPNAQTLSRGYVVERGTTAKIEVQHVDDTLVQTIWRAGNAVVLQTMLFQGLFELDRIENGQRTTYRPKSDLAKLFPLQPNTELAAEFETGQSGQPQAVKIALKVKDAATFDIGPCKFEVLAIDRSVTQGDAAPPIVYGEIYAPLIKLIVGKEFKNTDGTVTRTQYDKIYSR
jgi:hypothetical protein